MMTGLFKYLWIYVPNYNELEPFPLFWATVPFNRHKLDNKHLEKIKYLLSELFNEDQIFEQGMVISWSNLNLLDNE